MAGREELPPLQKADFHGVKGSFHTVDPNEKPIRKLCGASFLNFSERLIDQSRTLLGNRYLCIGGGLFLVGPSGMGKSVIVAQSSIEVACGLPTFGIKPPRPLKSLVVQAEDDDGDIIEMSQIVDHLELSKEQRKLVDQNTHVEFINDVTSFAFLDVLDQFLMQWPADLVWINPYTSYLGADIKDDKANTAFLRNGLNPILTKRQCAAIPIHHTPKTNFRDTREWKPSEWMYSGAGAAVLTNWARAYLELTQLITQSFENTPSLANPSQIVVTELIPKSVPKSLAPSHP